MDANKTSNIYHKTTIDVARVPYTTLSHIGRKRTFDESHGRQDAPRSAVLADISNHGGFQRPTLKPRCFEALKASEIQDVCERGQSEYTQRRGLALTPTPTSNPVLDLSHPGMQPRAVYSSIRKSFEFQAPEAPSSSISGVMTPETYPEPPQSFITRQY